MGTSEAKVIDRNKTEWYLVEHGLEASTVKVRPHEGRVRVSDAVEVLDGDASCDVETAKGKPLDSGVAELGAVCVEDKCNDTLAESIIVGAPTYIHRSLGLEADLGVNRSIDLVWKLGRKEFVDIDDAFSADDALGGDTAVKLSHEVEQELTLQVVARRKRNMAPLGRPCIIYQSPRGLRASGKGLAEARAGANASDRRTHGWYDWSMRRNFVVVRSLKGYDTVPVGREVVHEAHGPAGHLELVLEAPRINDPAQICEYDTVLTHGTCHGQTSGDELEQRQV